MRGKASNTTARADGAAPRAKKKVFEAAASNCPCSRRESLVDFVQARFEPMRGSGSAAGEPPCEPEAERMRDSPVSHLLSDVIDALNNLIRRVKRLNGLLELIRAEHGRSQARLVELESLLLGLRRELERHLRKEQKRLLPHVLIIEEVANREGRLSMPTVRTIRAPILVLLIDHEGLNNVLSQIREATGNYTAPPAACPAVATLYVELSELDKALEAHMRLEEDVLFPRAIDLQTASRRPRR